MYTIHLFIHLFNKLVLNFYLVKGPGLGPKPKESDLVVFHLPSCQMQPDSLFKVEVESTDQMLNREEMWFMQGFSAVCYKETMKLLHQDFHIEFIIHLLPS